MSNPNDAFGAPPPTPPPGSSFPPPQGTPPPPPAYGAPGGGQGQSYGGAPANQSNGLAIAALVLGVISLLGGLIPVVGWFTWPFALAAIGLGIAGLSRAKNINGTGKGMAMAGLVLGILAVLATIAWTIGLVVAADDIDDNDRINSDPANGECDSDRFLQDPDC